MKVERRPKCADSTLRQPSLPQNNLQKQEAQAKSQVHMLCQPVSVVLSVEVPVHPQTLAIAACRQSRIRLLLAQSKQPA